MIHYVIAEVDRGDAIVVREIECKASETLDELTARIHQNEHELILEGTRLAISKLWREREENQGA